MCAPADILLSLLAILFPPLPVWIKTGICSGASLLNLILLLLGYLPGLLHAWYIIAAIPDPVHAAYYYEEIPDPEAARTRHEHGPDRRGFAPRHQSHAGSVPGPDGAHGGYIAPPPQLGPRSYGAADGPGAGPSEQAAGAPPSYDQAVRGDNKVQT